jgi:hypothetical protein
MKSRLNFTYKVTRNDKVVAKCQTHSLRRFCYRIRSIKWQDGQSVYLRVNYGGVFHNDGDYRSKSELLEALSAFTEKTDL